jgi:biopolymer transport protein ExbB
MDKLQNPTRHANRLLAAALLASVLSLGGVQAMAQPATTAPGASAAVPAALIAAPALSPIAPPAAPVNAYAENPYGLRALWGQGDLVARGTLLVLLLMSIASWAVLVSKLIEQARMGRQARAAALDFWKADTVRLGAEALEAKSPYRYIAESALEASRKHTGLVARIDLNTWMVQSIERAVGAVQSRTQDGLAVLATVGSTAPFVGLFGTVWGIYNALVKIGASGQASIDKVAGPVGEALIMTALGLAVAVPAVLGYNWLVRRNKLAMDQVRAFSSDLHAVLLADDMKA